MIIQSHYVSLIGLSLIVILNDMLLYIIQFLDVICKIILMLIDNHTFPIKIERFKFCFNVRRFKKCLHVEMVSKACYKLYAAYNRDILRT